MTRRSLHRRYGHAASAMTKRFVVTRIPINRDGYDSRGRYYGSGAPLFSVLDNETEKEEVVRAANVKAAREKVMVGIFGPPARNPLHAKIKKLSKELYDELVKHDGRMPAALVDKYRSEVVALAAKVRPSTSGDRAWDYFDKDLDSGRLHGAVQMIAGAEERMKS
jgi:hypothetical protein